MQNLVSQYKTRNFTTTNKIVINHYKLTEPNYIFFQKQEENDYGS
jgi:hypothetical protein